MNNFTPVFLLIFICVFLLVSCITETGNTNSTLNYSYNENQKINYEKIKKGSKITCIKILEKNMKISDEHFKNIVKLSGEVTKKSIDEVYLKIEKISSFNLKKENNSWVKDNSIVKKPPFEIDEEYPFQEKNQIIDNDVSKGFYKIFFIK